MKFNKSSLLSSLAAAGIVLGAVAPVLAHAAGPAAVDNTGQNHAFNDDGTVTKLAVNTPAAYLSQVGNSYATSTEDNNDISGSAQGRSDAQVRLVAGYLTLDDVPDFNFGTVAVGSTAHLVNNTGRIADDGNSQGVLQVTDSRSSTPASGASGASQDGLGYHLTVRLGQFYKLDDTTGAYTDSAFSGFSLNLPQLDTTSRDSNGKLVVNADPKTSPTLFKISVPSDNTTAPTFLNAPKNHSYGTTSVNLTSGIDIGLATDSTAPKGAYDAPIYWLLMAQPTA
ncbi:WxL domain-containing protein [Schleiferilactobacillus harbinensis]|jgi:hypothetical protein|uniref:WxL domain-containing protein n=1 Tax=Schleiferilactobacillus harbinensis TaxID=304207 RepID=UPI00242E5AEF|nr:WxL domain-containing protein [Schleiferilactobacillus harbinensis]MCI1851949.1 WxL domain-containing protein [Schleiferilactobacillus harbinensis]